MGDFLRPYIQYAGDSKGSGQFKQSGGTNDIRYELDIGDSTATGVSGTYSLSGSGELKAGDGGEYIGYSPGCTGFFEQTGGTNSIDGTLVIAGSPGSSGTYDFNGGLLVLPSAGMATGSGTATFNFGGGTLRGGGLVFVLKT